MHGYLVNGMPRIFYYRQDRRAEGGEPGEVLGKRAATPSPPARESGERCELPQRGSGGRPDRPTFSHYFQHSGSVCLNTADHRR